MNFNYWKDYLNLKDVFFFKDSSLHKNNNSSLFTEIHTREPYKLKEQYKSLEKHLIYAAATPKERIKTQINNKLRSENEESFVKQKKISENGRINDQEEKIENSNSSINLKQNYFTDQDNIETLKESVKNEIYSLKLKMDLLKAAMSTELINTKTSQKTEKMENLKLGRENPKDNEVTKNSETEKEQNTFLPCFFCRKNGEQKSFYMSHTLKTNDGLVQCPILQKYVCPKCNATGQNAHTLLYCPLNKNDYQSTSLTHLTPRMSSGKKRNNFRTI